jgi:hypothetical protein
VTVERAKLPGEDASRWMMFALEDPNKPKPQPQ